jgi:hypothetical protein
MFEYRLLLVSIVRALVGRGVEVTVENLVCASTSSS